MVDEPRNIVADRLEEREQQWLIDCNRALTDARTRLISGEFDQPMKLAIYFAPLTAPDVPSPFATATANPIPMLLKCPECGSRHIDKGEFATKHHHTHACQHCGCCWRPAIVATVGVQFLPGFKDDD